MGNPNRQGTFRGSLIFILAVMATEAHCADVSFSASDQKAIVGAAEEVRKAIVAEDVPALLRLVTRTEGLTCTDTRYSLKEIRAFLTDKRSALYLGLFRSEEFLRKCGAGYPSTYPALSEKEFLQAADNSFSVKRLDANWARVTIASPIKTHYPREWYFHREGSAWKLAGASLIIGNCTCG